jgi:hypothetical protein
MQAFSQNKSASKSLFFNISCSVFYTKLQSPQIRRENRHTRNSQLFLNGCRCNYTSKIYGQILPIEHFMTSIWNTKTTVNVASIANHKQWATSYTYQRTNSSIECVFTRGLFFYVIASDKSFKQWSQNLSSIFMDVCKLVRRISHSRLIMSYCYWGKVMKS